MNVDQIYQLQRDDAFAQQFSAETYATFVAMPFSNRGGYPEGRIKGLLLGAHEEANRLLVAESPVFTTRRFAPLLRVDQTTSGAVVITDEIIRGILTSHFYVGDLTGCNFGVVLETGIALALKPNRRVLAFTQDGIHSLHFDLAVTQIYSYTEDTFVGQLAMGLVQAARAFETEADRYVRLISSQLTPDAISVLNIYGRLWKDRANAAQQPGVWADSAASYSSRFRKAIGTVAFHDAVRELSARRLLWTDYQPIPSRGVDAYAMHATSLGWKVIEIIWHHDPLMRRPANALTGPTFGDVAVSLGPSSPPLKRRSAAVGKGRPKIKRISKHKGKKRSAR